MWLIINIAAEGLQFSGESIMAKKLKAVAHTEDGLATTIRESANQIWLAGLGAFAKAQAEGEKVFEALVAEGQKLQEQTKLAADERISDIRTRGAGAWDKLEQVFEDRVARALHSLNVPTRKDIDVLSKRVAELTEVAKHLSKEEHHTTRAHAKK
jgi:poly(hydroxyalkanoate) granule-associated protein